MTVRTYREAMEAWRNGSFTQEKAQVWRRRLETVFNRGFWTGGYYLGMETGIWSGCGGSQATLRRQYLGKITNYYAKIGVAELRIETQTRIAPGNTLLIEGPTTGAVRTEPSELRLDAGPVPEAKCGDTVSFAVPCRVRTTDKVYVLLVL